MTFIPQKELIAISGGVQQGSISAGDTPWNTALSMIMPLLTLAIVGAATLYLREE